MITLIEMQTETYKLTSKPSADGEPQCNITIELNMVQRSMTVLPGHGIRQNRSEFQFQNSKPNMVRAVNELMLAAVDLAEKRFKAMEEKEDEKR